MMKQLKKLSEKIDILFEANKSEVLMREIKEIRKK